MMAFDRLEVGKLAYGLALAVHRATESFPKREWYGLASQARRAAFSIPLNLAEGAAKRGPREYRRYVDIAIGSLSELAIILRLARDLQMLANRDWEQLNDSWEKTGRLIGGLARALDRGGHKPSNRPTVQPSNRLTVQPS